MSLPKRFKRINALSTNRQRKSLNLLLDESQANVDKMTVRTIISCVEITGKTTTDELGRQVKKLVDGAISTSGKKKVHLADFSQEEKNAVISAVSRLEFSAKIWIHYDNGKNPTVAKVDALRNTVVALQKKHSKSDVNFLVEHATDYYKIVKDKFMTTNPYLSLLPDVCCYIMKLKLDKQSILENIPDDSARNKKSDELNRLISLMHEHIRLQAMNINGNYTELTRSNRL
jgi:hypothetical protein